MGDHQTWCPTCKHWAGGEECTRILAYEIQLGAARDALIRISHADTIDEARSIADEVVEPIRNALREAVARIGEKRD